MIFTLLRLLGSFCELLGVFFLSVEAMKLKNFRRLHNRIVKPFYVIINPPITFVDGPETMGASIQRRITDFIHDPITQIMTLLTSVGAIMFVGFVEMVDPVKTLLLEVTAQLKFPYSLILVFPFLFVSLLLGILIYTALVGALQLVMASLNFLNRYTPTGSIGILGFFLFFVAFVINNYLEFSLSK